MQRAGVRASALTPRPQLPRGRCSLWERVPSNWIDTVLVLNFIKRSKTTGYQLLGSQSWKAMTQYLPWGGPRRWCVFCFVEIQMHVHWAVHVHKNLRERERQHTRHNLQRLHKARLRDTLAYHECWKSTLLHDTNCMFTNTQAEHTDVHIYTHAHTHMHIHTCTNHVHKHTCTYTHAQTYARAHTHMHIHARAHTHMHIRAQTSTRAHMHIHAQTHTTAYMHTNAQTRVHSTHNTHYSIPNWCNVFTPRYVCVNWMLCVRERVCVLRRYVCAHVNVDV